jgi:hypothetical protein
MATKKNEDAQARIAGPEVSAVGLGGYGRRVKRREPHASQQACLREPLTLRLARAGARFTPRSPLLCTHLIAVAAGDASWRTAPADDRHGERRLREGSPGRLGWPPRHRGMASSQEPFDRWVPGALARRPWRSRSWGRRRPVTDLGRFNASLCANRERKRCDAAALDLVRQRETLERPCLLAGEQVPEQRGGLRRPRPWRDTLAESRCAGPRLPRLSCGTVRPAGPGRSRAGRRHDE